MHVLRPDFGDYPVPAITRAAVKASIARKSKQQRASRSLRNPNPNRPALSPKSIRDMVATLSAGLESAVVDCVVDCELLPSNALRGVLRRKNFPADAWRPKDERPRVLEPEDFKHAIEQLQPPVLQMALVAALAGLRWGEQVSLRIDEDVTFGGTNCGLPARSISASPKP